MSIEKRGVQSIEVGGRLLQALIDAERPLMLRELARGARLAPAQAHAYLVSFRKQGLIDQDAAAGRYRLGPLALRLGVARMRSFDPLRMAGDAIVGFARETGFTIALAVWGTHGPTIVAVEDGADAIYTNTRAGIVYSVSGTATGHVFSAFMPESLIKAATDLENAEGSRTKRIGRPIPFRSLRPRLPKIRALGFATIDPQPVPGIAALSAPVFDHVGQIRMAVTVIGPANYLDATDASPTARVLLAFARDLSAKLGYKPIPAAATPAGPPVAPPPGAATRPGPRRKPPVPRRPPPAGKSAATVG